MLSAFALGLAFLPLQSDGAKLLDEMLTQLEAGRYDRDSVLTVIAAGPAILPIVRQIHRFLDGDLEYAVELRYECGDPELRTWCLKVLESGGSQERAAGMRGLFRVGTQTDLPVIRKGFGDPNTEVWTAFALGRLKDKQAIPDLVARLGKSGGNEGASSAAPHVYTGTIKDASVSALIRIGEEAGPAVTAFLERCKDLEGIQNACRVLRSIGYPSCVDALYHAANRLAPSASGRGIAQMIFQDVLEALAIYGDPRVKDFLGDDASVSVPKRVPLQGTNNLARRLETLITSRYWDAAEATYLLNSHPLETHAFLKSYFSSTSMGQISIVLESLAENDESALAGPIWTELAHSKNSEVRTYLASSLRFNRSPVALSLMADPDPEVRKKAREAAAIHYGVPMAMPMFTARIEKLVRQVAKN